MTIKQERAAHLILEVVAELLFSEVTDPALQDVTLTDVKVDREIEYADVFIHSPDDQEAVMAGLERASGFLRHELAIRTRFRKTPVLRFHWDPTIEEGERIDHLIEALHHPPETQEDTDDDTGME